MHVPSPVISLAVEPKNKQDIDKLGKALQRFVKEDPTFRVHIDEESSQTIVSVGAWAGWVGILAWVIFISINGRDSLDVRQVDTMLGWAFWDGVFIKRSYMLGGYIWVGLRYSVVLFIKGIGICTQEAYRT